VRKASIYRAFRSLRKAQMPTVHLVVGCALIVLNLAAGVMGALLLVLGHKPDDGLHVLYGVLPLAVAFIAEQLRIVSADAVLASRGYGSAQDVGELSEDEQRVIVLSIVRREMGVMALSCFVIVALAVRAATTSGAF
jgi:hypothetical protein